MMRGLLLLLISSFPGQISAADFALQVREFGAHEDLELEDQVEGWTNTFVIRVKNRTGRDLTGLKAHVGCKWIVANVSSTVWAADELVDVIVRVTPTRGLLREELALTAVDGKAGRTVKLLTVGLSAHCDAPLRPESRYYAWSADGTAQVRLVSATDLIDVGDLGEVKFQSKFIKVLDCEKVKDGCLVTLQKTLDEAEFPTTDTGGLLTAPFSVGGGKKMLMSEYVTFVAHERIDFAPGPIRLSVRGKNRRRVGGSMKVRDYSESRIAMVGALVERRGDEVHVLSANLDLGMALLKKDNPFQVSFATRVYEQQVQDWDSIYVVLHRDHEALDLDLKWDDFFERYGVCATKIQSP